MREFLIFFCLNDDDDNNSDVGDSTVYCSYFFEHWHCDKSNGTIKIRQKWSKREKAECCKNENNFKIS